MLVCNVSMRAPRRAIAADLVEAGAAADDPGTGQVVFATLVDDPASVAEIVDAYLGEIMVEATAAADNVNAGFDSSVGIAETMTTQDSVSATVTAGAPLDGTSPTAAWSLSRKLLTAYGGSYYAASGGVLTFLNDQSGSTLDFQTFAGAPVITPAGPNSRAAVDFNGTSDFLRSSVGGASVAPLSSFISAGSGFIVCSAIVTAISTNNATVYSNSALFGDQSQYMGLHFRTTGGGTVYAYNYDGTAKSTSTTVSTGVPVVFAWRHEGGNLYLSLNGGTEVSVASGNTQVLTGAFQLGSGAVAMYLDCTVFEMATWSTVPGATARANIIADFKSWCGA